MLLALYLLLLLVEGLHVNPPQPAASRAAAIAIKRLCESAEMNIIAGPMLQVYNQIAASSSSSSSSSNGNGSSAAAAASVVVSLKDELHVLEGEFSLSLLFSDYSLSLAHNHLNLLLSSWKVLYQL
jgi:hypothetical protein